MLGGDLNSHGSPRLLLRQVRLPISPPQLYGHYITNRNCLVRPPGVRTWDLLVKSELLYQLSYGRVLDSLVAVQLILTVTNATQLILFQDLNPVKLLQSSLYTTCSGLKNRVKGDNFLFCAESGTRTHTRVFRLSQDFKSCASTIPPSRLCIYSTSLRPGRELNPRMSLLQSDVLPLHHLAISLMILIFRWFGKWCAGLFAIIKHELHAR